jgi:DNA-binding response OmpR family regulator
MLRQANETILLIEDDEAEVLLIQQAVASCPEKLHLAVARDTGEALEWLSDTVERGYSMPRMILLDLKLPKLAGLAVLRTLRLERRLQDVPIVVFSEQHEPPDVVLSYQLGANSFVERPGNLAEFTRLLRELAERGWLSGKGLHHSDPESLTA